MKPGHPAYMLLTTYDATRRLHGVLASRYTLEACVGTDTGHRVCTTVAEGWMRPQNYHVYELVDVTPAPAVEPWNPAPEVAR